MRKFVICIGQEIVFGRS